MRSAGAIPPVDRARIASDDERALHIAAECLVEVCFGDLPQRHELAEAGVGEEDVETPLLLQDRGEQSIKVGKRRDITLHRRARTSFLHWLDGKECLP